MSDVPKPPSDVTLTWTEGLQFTATSGSRECVMDGDSRAGLSPMELLAAALSGCMAADIVSILQKCRQPLTGLTVTLRGERAPEAPRRFVRIQMTVQVTGPVEQSQLDRAIALSRDKYCSVWHSMRPETPFDITTEIAA